MHTLTVNGKTYIIHYYENGDQHWQCADCGQRIKKETTLGTHSLVSSCKKKKQYRDSSGNTVIFTSLLKPSIQFIREN